MSDKAGKEQRTGSVRDVFGRKPLVRHEVAGVIQCHYDHHESIKTSTEANRGPCAGRRAGLVLTMLIAGELAAVTIPYLYKQVVFSHSYFDRNA